MINLKKTIRSGINLSVTLNDAEYLKLDINKLLNNEILSLNYVNNFANNIFKECDKLKNVNIEFKITNSELEFIKYIEGIIIFELELDTYELLSDLLEGLLNNENFAPEITEVFVKNKKIKKQLYLSLED